MATSKKPRFSTILSWRGKDTRSSDLEYELRPHCQKLIVKPTPLSGAHLLMTSERIAVRAYYPCDLHELREEKEKEQSTGSNSDKDDFDGMSTFFSSFQIALVFFIMPTMKNANSHDLIAEQLDNMDSLFHKAQRLSVRHQEEIEEKNHNNTSGMNGVSTRKSLVMILPETQSAIQNLIAIADGLSQERRASKKALLQRLEAKFFLPSYSGRNIDVISTNRAEAVNPFAVASHVELGLREMARIFELPPGEAEILMSELGDLKTIATADESLLETIPIDRRTRMILHCFFGSPEGKIGAVARMAQAPGPRLSLQQNQFQHDSDLQSVSGVTTQHFSHSNSSRLPSSHSEPHVSSRLQPFQAHHLGPQSQFPQQQLFDPNMADESWFEDENTHGSQFSFDVEDNNILEAGSVFTIHEENSDVNGGPSFFPTPVAMGAYPMVGGSQNLGMQRGYSQYNTVHPPSLDISNAIDSFQISSGQAYHGGIRFHPHQMVQRYSNSSQQQGPYQFPVEQSSFPDPYAHSQWSANQNELIVPVDDYQYGHPAFQTPMSRQGDDHRQRHYQKQHFYNTNRFHR